jgi:hypothetical protein
MGKLGVAVALEANVDTTVLYFKESEAGVEPYDVRYLISGEHLRIDDAKDDSDYLLFDKRSNQLISVNHQERTLLKISTKAKLSDKPFTMEPPNYAVTKNQGVSFPPVMGFKTQSFVLSVGEKICAQSSVAIGLMPKIVSMLKAYESLLSLNNQRNMSNIPSQYVTPCMLVNDIFAVDWYLLKGFPVLLNRYEGLQRLLINVEQKEVKQSLFSLPDNYAWLDLSRPMK